MEDYIAFSEFKTAVIVTQIEEKFKASQSTKKENGDIMLPDLKLYYKILVIKTE